MVAAGRAKLQTVLAAGHIALWSAALRDDWRGGMALVMVRRDDAAQRRFYYDGDRYRTTRDYFGRSSGNGSGAEAFALEVENRTLGAHFHPVDQFQVLIGDEGSIYQRHAISPLTLHFADAFSTYGPIIGGPRPLQLLTLRAEATDETNYMPEDRDQLLYRGQRNVHVDASAIGAVEPGAGETIRTTQLFDDHEDGFGARKISSAAGVAFEVPSAAGSGGQYIVVARGSVTYAGGDYGDRTVGWMDSTDGPVELVAGGNGCEILVCRFPVTPTRNVRLGDAATSAH